MTTAPVKLSAHPADPGQPHKIVAAWLSRVNSALGGPAGWVLLLLSIAVLTLSLERIRFWALWWKRSRALQRQWQEVLQLGGGRVLAWMEDQDMQMRFGQSFLEAAIVIAPLLGLLGTVLGLSRLLSAMGPQLVLPPGMGLRGFGELLLCTASGLAVSLLATVTWHGNNALRQWQRSLWQRDVHRSECPP